MNGVARTNSFVRGRPAGIFDVKQHRQTSSSVPPILRDSRGRTRRYKGVVRTCFSGLLPVWAAVLLTCAGCGREPQGGSGAAEFAVEKTYEQGPATAHVRLDKTELTAADTILLELEAAVPQGYEVEMPDVAATLQDFAVIDWKDLGERLDDSGRVVTTRRYRLEPFLLGEGEVPGVTFTAYDANEPETKYELTTEPIPVQIASAFTDPNEQVAIEDIEGVVEMPKEPFPWWLLFPAMAIIHVFAALVGRYLAQRYNAKARMRVYRSAHEVAFARLDALAAEKLVEQGRVKEFYERISGILRRYIEDRFDLRAPERTTEEFLAEMQEANVLPADDKQTLGDFLTHCDLVKFARHEPAREQIDRTFALARDFVERTRSDEHRVDVTDEDRLKRTIELVAAGSGDSKSDGTVRSDAARRSSEGCPDGHTTNESIRQSGEDA